jgi:hypothetical protein
MTLYNFLKVHSEGLSLMSSYVLYLFTAENGLLGLGSPERGLDSNVLFWIILSIAF